MADYNKVGIYYIILYYAVSPQYIMWIYQYKRRIVVYFCFCYFFNDDISSSSHTNK